MERLICYCVKCNGIWFNDQAWNEQHIVQSECGCSPDSVGLCVQGDAVKVYANFYELGSTYGLLEEGGWNKTTFDPITCVRIEAVFEEDWEDVGSPESGPRLVYRGLEIVPLNTWRDVLAEMKKAYGADMPGSKIVMKLEIGIGQYYEDPPFYS